MVWPGCGTAHTTAVSRGNPQRARDPAYDRVSGRGPPPDERLPAAAPSDGRGGGGDGGAEQLLWWAWEHAAAGGGERPGDGAQRLRQLGADQRPPGRPGPWRARGGAGERPRDRHRVHPPFCVLPDRSRRAARLPAGPVGLAGVHSPAALWSPSAPPLVRRVPGLQLLL